ncbi:glycoside hydrolase family 5 protein [Mesorhizobium sp. SP-1A]|uniref:glycoside hydrolase family 5 protein n=1 Tax=Mesorhizobium sp. SP-1A TaxID=3077840 RepID=UPI0028F6C421|nr:glycoside hydrolase family 5 protein [Mesorhizobium sp. SP-1A]
MLSATQAFPAASKPGCFHGVNLSGAEFGKAGGIYGKDYTYPSDRTVAYFAKKGFNTVRLPFLWERLQPRLGEAFDKAEAARLADAVSRLRAAGLHVVLDPHNYARYRDAVLGSDDLPDAAFADLWGRLAVLYGKDAAVAFGLMNEPHDLDVRQWLSSANAAIAAIRKAGARNLVLVPGTNWTGAHSWESTDAANANASIMLGVQDPANNYAYEVHQYLDGNFSGTHATCERADDAVEALQRFTQWLRDNGKRGFLGEFGGGGDANCAKGITGMVEVMEKNRDVWTGWAYWAAGDWWPESEPLNIQPVKGRDRPQLKALSRSGALFGGAGKCPALENGG